MIRPLRKGWLGYVGDVNGEEDTDAKVFGIVEDYLDIPYMVTFAGTADPWSLVWCLLLPLLSARWLALCSIRVLQVA